MNAAAYMTRFTIMRPTRLAIFLVSALLGYAAARGGEPGPATSAAGSSPPQPGAAAPAGAASAKSITPFWLAPKLDLSLSVATVTLDSVPSNGPFALLQAGNVDPRTFAVSNPAVLPFITGTDTGYELIPGGLKRDALINCDRKYAIKKLPDALAGLSLLRTRSGDKAVLDARFAIVVTSPKPCYVLVAIDERALNTYKQFGAPGWLQEFAPTDFKIQTDDPLMADANASFQVFARKAPSGRIVLGPPCMDVSFNAMYFAFFAEAK